MNAIEMTGVTKAYDGRPVLDGLDLRVAAGEVFALLGPNGAGKTTVVEILEGYRRADHGTVNVLGHEPAAGGPAFRSRIGIVLQQTTSFERSTVREVVEMFAAVFPDPRPVDEVIADVGLDERRHDIVDTMSGGQRRRLDLACGLVGRPELLFLDEPTTGLDPEARRVVWDLISGLGHSGTTVLLTTHHLEEAERLADRIGILLDGRIRDVAEPDRLGDRDKAEARVRFTAATGEVVVIVTDRPGGLVADLVSQHGEPAGLTVERPSLEDVYFEMVAKETGAVR